MSVGASNGGRGGRSEAGTGLGLRGRALAWLALSLVGVSATLIAVEMLGVPFTAFDGAIHETRERVFSKLRLVADTKAERLLRWLEERRDDIEVIAGARVTQEAIRNVLAALDPPGASNGASTRAAVARSGSYEALRSSLIDVRDRYGVYERISIAAADPGVVVVSTDESLVGAAIDGGPAVLQATRSGKTVLQAQVSDDGTLDLVVARAATLRAPDTGGADAGTAAIVVAEVHSEDIFTPLLYTGGELGETGEVVLVDAARSNLTELRHPLPGGQRPATGAATLEGRPVQLAAAGGDGAIEALDYRGEAVLAAYRHLALPGGGSWGLVVKQDTAEALAPVWRRFYFTSALAGIGTLTLLGLAAVILTALTRPLRELGEVADRVRRGDLGARTSVASSPELAAVGTAFNAMLERLQTRQEKAEGSAMLFRRLLDRSGEEIYVFDTAGRFVDVNQTALDQLGYGYEELLELRVSDVVLDSDEESWARTLDQLDAGERLVKEGRHRRRDGSTYPVETTLVLQDVAGEPYVLAVIRDITERRDAETERRRLATAVEQSADAVMITDTDGRIQYANSAFEEVSGYPPEQAIGKNPRFLKSGEHDEAFYADLWETITAAQPWQGTMTNRGRDGHLYRVETTITPLLDETGTITNFVAVQHDVTAREEVESQLRQAQKMEGVGQLAAGIAHDFNNLLTGITGYSQLLRGQLGDGAEREDVDKIFALAQQAAGLTRQLLVFSRRAPTDPVPIDLNETVASTFKLVKRLIGEDIEVVKNLADGLATVEADRGQIEQVVVNLCVNARDAMPDGGRIEVTTRNVMLDREFARTHLGAEPGPHVMLSVSDTGVGMDAATRERVFEPFFTTKEMGHGTGLGLATVHGIVQQHGGTIWVDSTPGDGATFSVYLPQVDAEPREAGELDSEELPSGTETILVVEDEEAVRRIVERMLRARGYEVISAADPGEALETFDALGDGVDLLFTDVVMPETSGHRLAKVLRKRSPGLKVLFMSGYTERAREKRGALELGAPLLEKPFTPGTLARKIREVLDSG